MINEELVYIASLVRKSFSDKLSESEKLSLDRWATERPERMQILEELKRVEMLIAESETVSNYDIDGMRSAIAEYFKKSGYVSRDIPKEGSVLPARRVHFLKASWIRYAAAILLFLGIGAYLYFHQKKNLLTVETNQVIAKNDLLPGQDRAVLTLSNGKQIQIDSATSETIQDQTLSIENKDGQLVYKKSELVAKNTMTTPNGGQYKLVLSDGTKVWMNAASSITYPTAFTGEERAVTITGEVYFEVASLPAAKGKMPFKVNVITAQDESRNMEITVLGTHFNVNAYGDEPTVNASLMEGSIKLTKGTDQYLLQPGQQAQLINKGIIKITNGINAEEVLAWKNGYFYFKHADIQTVMRQLARWYNVSVEYHGKIPDMKFGGEISRNTNASDILKILYESGLRFTVEGKKIIIKS